MSAKSPWMLWRGFRMEYGTIITRSNIALHIHPLKWKGRRDDSILWRRRRQISRSPVNVRAVTTDDISVALLLQRLPNNKNQGLTGELWIIYYERFKRKPTVVNNSATMYLHCIIFTHLHFVACVRRWTGSSLVKIMACRLFGDKPLSKPVMISHTKSITKLSKLTIFYWRYCTWKLSFVILQPFCPGGDELDYRLLWNYMIIGRKIFGGFSYTY